LVVALWGVALIVTVVLVERRYQAAVSGPVGGDFSVYLHAARQIAAGHSPYQSNHLFVYPPPLALFLVPFVHAAPIHVFRAWTIVELVALVAGAGAFVGIEAPRLKVWLQPVVFMFCIVTALHFWPLTLGLSLGQVDTFVFAVLMVSALAASRDRPGSRGALIGAAALLKAWPAAVAVSLFQRGMAHRFRALGAFVATVLAAPVLALAFGGGSGLMAFVESVFDSRSQHLVNDSVWGAPSLLFSNTGLARPLLVSGPLHAASAAVLLIWVLGLLVVALRTPGDKVMCTWNVTVCVVLLLPVSHLAYSLYCLPVLWLWSARSLKSNRSESRQLVVVAVLLLWWIIQTKSWPDSGSSSTIGALHYCVVFTANLVACTASVIGARCIRTPEPDGDERDRAGATGPEHVHGAQEALSGSGPIGQ
jgi:hypothetical protein